MTASAVPAAGAHQHLPHEPNLGTVAKEAALEFDGWKGACV